MRDVKDANSDKLGRRRFSATLTATIFVAPAQWGFILRRKLSAAL
jgi:hypothetical protein